MKKNYVLSRQLIGLVIFWTGLVIHPAGGQSIPDAQWARVGRTLAITTDGNIATGDGLQVVKYDLDGDKLRSSGLIGGTSYIGGKIPGCPSCLPNVGGYSAVTSILFTNPTSNGGILLIGREYGTGYSILARLNANLGSEGAGQGVAYALGTPDAGVLTLTSGIEYNDTKIKTFIRRNGPQASWSRSVAFPAPYPATPDNSATIGNVAINTPDGGYLVAGYFNSVGDYVPGGGWVAKLNGNGDVMWQRLLNGLPLTMNINGPLPGSITALKSVTDVLVSADGTGYALVGAGVVPAKYPGAPNTAIVELNADGSFRRARVIDNTFTDAYITVYSGAGGKKYYAVGNSSLQNGVDPQILLVDPTEKPLNEPDLLKVVARRTFEGPGDGPLVKIGVAGDGSLVFATANNQLVKLVPESQNTGAFRLTTPTYNCQTGAIVFNTSGGDGSLITYEAPGISRASATSNTGTVEEGLRNDPKIIPITATQNGVSVVYKFDLRAPCSNTTAPQPPLSYPIPNLSYKAGEPLLFSLGSYFSDPTTGIPGYNSDWMISAEGLPDGLELQVRSYPYYTIPNIPIVGTPRTPGVYTVNVTASTSGYRSDPLRATFTITITPNGQPVEPPTPPVTGGSLTLTQPTYTCATGAITFNTSGGDGSPIIYIAPGISRSSLTSNTGIVEQGLRNDPKPLTITATQNGITVSYTFDFGGYCANPQPPVNPPTGNALALLPPAYDCATGAITFRTSGGNGTPIEYAAAGITGWTSNPNQFVDQDSRTANDVQPFMLMARQNGVTVTYEWNLKAACGRARTGAVEPEAELSLTVLGNPTTDRVRVRLGGVDGRSVRLVLSDAGGRVLENRFVEGTEGNGEQVFDLQRSLPGLLLLRATTPSQTKSVKILKQ
ncbi:hypothetical protein [Spirosoma utsteinense]|uniref:Uncharacterized protein n=1 Tax=Spirosoma utsteinense TaxID=2585773 RepID=A0ABR6WBA5_9BACT|nr:hypothetical protein [Spirosoma utsteinense]MBC3786450.1 hypothetical protein [Spirosoma utsteinense]MBC3793837.1 hypothetical protein [Spirosoma utsteinense]